MGRVRLTLTGMDSKHFQVIVVGSGFGGSVISYRLAKEGHTVCLLERGRKYPPGSFPRTQHGMSRNLWDPSEGDYGLFNIWSFRGIEAVISSGLGGGSLIYANVLLRKPEEWFVENHSYKGSIEHWPIKYGDLAPHYDCVEAMLEPQTYPLAEEPYDLTFKAHALIKAAESLNLKWEPPKLAVTFANPGQQPIPGEPIKNGHNNIHKRTRYTCRLCGECDIGCNYGSKNTLDYNYLSRADKCGADIRTLSEVTFFRPTDRGFAVVYRKLNPAEKARRGEVEEVTLTCDRLVLSAGTFGSTYLLLRNRNNFRRLSHRLGHGFSGNGDLLTFAMKCREEKHGRLAARDVSPSYGPVITTSIQVMDKLGDGRAGRGYYIQDAGFPAFISWMVEASQIRSTVRRVLRMTKRRVLAMLRRDPMTDVSREIAAVLGACELSSGSIPLLGMGRDVPDGTMALRDGRYLDVDWDMETSRDYFAEVRGTMREISDELNAKFVDNPTFRLSRVITVHPLGGCPMGTKITDGVVDSYGEVFGYKGLYVADGSVMPGPVGPNPALTIAAFADRTADHIIDQINGNASRRAQC